ncbi:MAG: type I secretion C-terminal target domain-containing protein, partial [Alphaproteobacteria bacterium]
SKLGGSLTSHGVPVLVSATAGGYVGKANGVDVFTLSINPTTGAYTFTLLGVLDHADAGNPNDSITLNFGVKGTDADGDVATTTLTVNVLDDAPVAHNDHNTQTGTATGNVITGLNGGVGAADDLSNDTNNTVVKIVYGGVTYDVPAVGQATINAAFGQLKISANGAYTYVPTGGVTGCECGTDLFTYVLKDGDGDTSSAVLTLDCVPLVNVDIKVNNGADAVCVKEDGQVSVPVVAGYTGGDGDEVMTLKVTGIDPSWTITATGWVNNGGGVYTLALPTGQRNYTGSFTFKPPHDSDVDMNGVNFTASVFDPDTAGTVVANDQISIQVDAVIDTPVLTVPTSIGIQSWYYKNTAYQVPLNIASNTTDVDGSEIVTKIVIKLNEPLSNPVAPFYTLDDMGIGLNKGTEVSPGVWEIAVNSGDAAAALSGLKLLVPSGANYTAIHNSNVGNENVNIVVQSYVKEKVAAGDGNAEWDFTDNQTCVIKSFCLTFRITPLVLDLNGNGIELIPADAGVMFDMNNNGTLDKTSWVGGNDGLLALDVNGDGVITNQSELFGNTDTLDHGFANLAGHDINGDGTINSSDAIFQSLLIWQDANSDGVSQSAELHSLSDLGIVSIDLAAIETGVDVGDAYVSHQSTFTLADGSEQQIVDAWFNVIEGNNLDVGAFLEGTQGKDIIFGTENNDIIVGNSGNDVFYGQGGDDTFLFQSFDGSVDVIKDFDLGDALDVSGLLQGYDAVQDSINDFVFKTESAGNTTVYVNADGVGGLAGATAIATLEGVVGLNIEQITNDGKVVV